jgi:hypothetical protein
MPGQPQGDIKSPAVSINDFNTVDAANIWYAITQLSSVSQTKNKFYSIPGVINAPGVGNKIVFDISAINMDFPNMHVKLILNSIFYIHQTSLAAPLIGFVNIAFTAPSVNGGVMDKLPAATGNQIKTVNRNSNAVEQFTTSDILAPVIGILGNINMENLYLSLPIVDNISLLAGVDGEFIDIPGLTQLLTFEVQIMN